MPSTEVVVGQETGSAQSATAPALAVTEPMEAAVVLTVSLREALGASVPRFQTTRPSRTAPPSEMAPMVTPAGMVWVTTVLVAGASPVLLTVTAKSTGRPTKRRSGASQAMVSFGATILVSTGEALAVSAPPLALALEV